MQKVELYANIIIEKNFNKYFIYVLLNYIIKFYLIIK